MSPRTSLEHRPHRRLNRDTVRTLGTIAFAGLAFLSVGRLFAQTMQETDDQHEGNSSPAAEVVDVFTQDLNRWEATKHMYVGDEDGFGSRQALNDAAAVVAVAAGAYARAKAGDRGGQY